MLKEKTISEIFSKQKKGGRGDFFFQKKIQSR